MQEVPVNGIYCLHVNDSMDDFYDSNDDESIYQRWAVALLHICEYARIYDKHNGSWSDYVISGRDENVREGYIQQQNRQIREMQQLYPKFNNETRLGNPRLGTAPPPFFGYPITNPKVIHNLRKVIPGNGWDVLFVYIPPNPNDPNFVMKTFQNITRHLCGDGKLCKNCTRHHLHFSEKYLEIIWENISDMSFKPLLQKMAHYIQNQMTSAIAKPGAVQYPSSKNNDEQINVPKSEHRCEILKLEEEFLYAKRRIEGKSKMLSKTMTFLNQDKPIQNMQCALRPNPMTARHFQPHLQNPYPMMRDETNPYNNNRAPAFMCFKDKDPKIHPTSYHLKDFDDPFTKTTPKQFMQLFVSGDADYMTTNKPQGKGKGGKYKNVISNLLGTLRR